VDFKMRLDPRELRKLDMEMNRRTRIDPDSNTVLENAALEIAEAAPVTNCVLPDQENFFAYHFIHYEYEALPDARQRSQMSRAAIQLAEKRQKLYQRDRFSRMSTCGNCTCNVCVVVLFVVSCACDTHALPARG